MTPAGCTGSASSLVVHFFAHGSLRQLSQEAASMVLIVWMIQESIFTSLELTWIVSIREKVVHGLRLQALAVEGVVSLDW